MTERRNYRESPKHCEPITAQKPGVKCPDWSKAIAQQLLDESEKMGTKRVATRCGIAFVAVSTNDGTWHGYPEAWDMIDSRIVDRWRKAGRIRGRDIRRFAKRSSLRDSFGGSLP